LRSGRYARRGLDESEQAIAKLRASGYTEVTKIEADDGHWEGKGIKNGHKMKFHADPRTGTYCPKSLITDPPKERGSPGRPSRSSSNWQLF
jgi:hypothetical protein